MRRKEDKDRLPKKVRVTPWLIGPRSDASPVP